MHQPDRLFAPPPLLSPGLLQRREDPPLLPGAPKRPPRRAFPPSPSALLPSPRRPSPSASSPLLSPRARTRSPRSTLRPGFYISSPAVAPQGWSLSSTRRSSSSTNSSSGSGSRPSPARRASPRSRRAPSPAVARSLACLWWATDAEPVAPYPARRSQQRRAS